MTDRRFQPGDIVRYDCTAMRGSDVVYLVVKRSYMGCFIYMMPNGKTNVGVDNNYTLIT